MHGHCHARLAKVLYDQASTLEHVIFAGFTHPPALRLTKALRAALPHCYERFFFSDNGSTSVEVALKMALQYYVNLGAPRQRIIALSGGYHGDTFGAMSLGGKSVFTRPFTSHMFDVEVLPFPTAKNELIAHNMLKKALKSGQIAAFVFEPLVQAAAGMRFYAAEWLEEAITLCHKAGTLCIADEVFTGFGRTGRLFATATLPTAPDLIALSKGLTGGMMPLGITACQHAVYQAFNSDQLDKTFFHGHSYTANPLACRVAEESLNMLQESGTKGLIEALSKAQFDFFSSLNGHPKVADARSLGTIGALTLRSRSSTGYENPLRRRIYDFFMQRDILLRPLGNVIYVLPPYSISRTDLAHIYESIRAFLSEVPCSE